MRVKALFITLIMIVAMAIPQTIMAADKMTYEDYYEKGYHEGYNKGIVSMAELFQSLDYRYPYLATEGSYYKFVSDEYVGFWDGYVDGYFTKQTEKSNQNAIQPISTQITATDSTQTTGNMLTETPRYLQTDKFGYYACYTNVLQQYTEDGWKQALDLGAGTTAYNSATGENINDWRSFYITDLTAGYFDSYQKYENILISGLVMIPDRHDNTKGRLADVFILYYPKTGKTKTLHINLRYPMQISKEQHNMTRPFEYLESKDVLFPRGIITKNGSGDVFVLSGSADLNLFKSKNQEMLEEKSYDGDFFEIVRLCNADKTSMQTTAYSEFFGPTCIFDKEWNTEFQIPELKNMNHTIDCRLIVFRTDDYRAFTIASVGTDDSDFCTAIAINIWTKPKDEYYWIGRDKFMQLAGIAGLSDSFGTTWTEKDMDSYIDK